LARIQPAKSPPLEEHRARSDSQTLAIPEKNTSQDIANISRESSRKEKRRKTWSMTPRQQKKRERLTQNMREKLERPRLLGAFLLPLLNSASAEPSCGGGNLLQL
jgi:hypothetical protein